MANTVLVASAPANVNKKSLVTSKCSKSFDRAKQTKSSVDRKTKLATPDMDSFRENPYAGGPGAVSHYELTWCKCDSWCSRRKIDPIRCPMREVVQFLTECF